MANIVLPITEAQSLRIPETNFKFSGNESSDNLKFADLDDPTPITSLERTTSSNTKKIKRVAKNVGKKAARKLSPKRRSRNKKDKDNKDSAGDYEEIDEDEEYPSTEEELCDVLTNNPNQKVYDQLNSNFASKDEKAEMSSFDLAKKEGLRRQSDGCLLSMNDDDDDDDRDEEKKDEEAASNVPKRISDPIMRMTPAEIQRAAIRRIPSRSGGGKSSPPPPLSRRGLMQRTSSCRDVAYETRREKILEQVEGRRQQRFPESRSSDQLLLRASSFNNRQRSRRNLNRGNSQEDEQGKDGGANFRWPERKTKRSSSQKRLLKSMVDRDSDDTTSKNNPSTADDMAANMAALVKLVSSLQTEVSALRKEVKELRPLKHLLDKVSMSDLEDENCTEG